VNTNIMTGAEPSVEPPAVGTYVPAPETCVDCGLIAPASLRVRLTVGTVCALCLETAAYARGYVDGRGAA
jgi:hypothetical protein